MSHVLLEQSPTTRTDHGPTARLRARFSAADDEVRSPAAGRPHVAPATGSSARESREAMAGAPAASARESGAATGPRVLVPSSASEDTADTAIPVSTREPATGPRAFVLSSASEAGVRGEAAALAEWLTGDGADASLGDVAHSLLVHRSRLSFRAAVVAGDRAGLVDVLGRVAAGETSPHVATGRVGGDLGSGTVWVFSGHGSQWDGMGRDLLAHEPAFRAVIDLIDPVFSQEIGFSPRDVIRHGPLVDVDVVQPMIFAVQVGLAAVLRDRGLRPAAVIGHSVGEIAAAVAAGIFDVVTAARLVCRRSALLRKAEGGGAMAMVDLSFADVRERLTGPDVVAAIAASPLSTVVSGTPAGVAALTEQWTADGVMVRPVPSTVAFHSPQMDPLLDDLVAALADLPPSAPTVPVYSTALPDPRATDPRDGRYWATNLRDAVRLDTAVAAAFEDGHRVFLELAPHPVVTYSIAETLADTGAFVTGTLRRDRPERDTLLANLGALHCHGVDAGLHTPGARTALPRRAWQHGRYWRTPSSTPTSGHDVDSHTLLGTPVTVAGTSARLWRTHLDRHTLPYPGAHPIHGVEVVPAAVLLTTFLAAGATRSLTDVRLAVPVAVTGDHDVQVVHADDTVRLATRQHDTWLTRATATLGTVTADVVPATGLPPLPPSAVTDRLRAVGVADVGFPWEIVALAGAGGDLTATVRADGPAALLDAVLSVAPLVFPDDGTLRMPTAIAGLTLADDLPAQCTVHVRLSDRDTTDVLITHGESTLGALTGLRFGTLDGAVDPRQLVHTLDWRPADLTPDPRARLRTVALVGDGPLADVLAATLADRRCLRVPDPAGLADLIDDLGRGDAVLVVPAADPVASAWRLASTARLLLDRCGALPPRLWAVTRGAWADGDVTHSAVWGLARVIAGEHPELATRLVDLADDADLHHLVPLLCARSSQDGYRVRHDGVVAARLVPLTGEPREPRADALRCRADSTYLITGGLGALGVEVATWLASRGARRLVLTGRTPLPPRATWDSVSDPRVDAVRSLEALGVTVRVLAFDIADRAAAAEALAPDTLGLPPIRGVVHAAGVLDDRMLGSLDEESLRTVLRPKVDGALVLDALFPPGSLDFLALFSSVGYQLGLTGQASYATANACLDALARRRRAAGDRATTSLAWTSWRGKGMGANDFVDRELAGLGVGDVTPADAFRAWELASRFDAGYVAVLRTVAATGTSLPILAELGGPDAEPETEDGPVVPAGLDPAELRAVLLDEVTRQLEAELRISAATLDVHRPLTELGLDSIMTQVLRRGLEKRLRLTLPATLVWNHPTAAAVADHLATRLSV